MASSLSTKTLYVAKSWHSRLAGGTERVNLAHCKESLSVDVAVPDFRGKETAVTLSGDGSKFAVAQEFLESKLGFKMSAVPLLMKPVSLVPLEVKAIVADREAFIAIVRTHGAAVIFPPAHNPSADSWIQAPKEAIARVLSAFSKVCERELSVHDRKREADEDSSKTPSAASIVAKSAGVKKTRGSRVMTVSRGIADVMFFHPFEDDEADFENLLSYLMTAKSTIDLCVFSLTDNRIRYALSDVVRNGVRVRLITDNSQTLSLGSDAEWLDSRGIRVKVDYDPEEASHMHHKFCVIDGTLLLTGSFNWTWSASHKNYENICVTDTPKLVRAYARYYEKLYTSDRSIVDIEKFMALKRGGR